MVIEKSKYESTLWGKKCIGYEINTLEELRELKKRHLATTIYMFNDGCLSFRTLDSIRKDCKGKTVKINGDETKTMYNYYMDGGHITKLANKYVFRCETLRGYPNTYIILWYTKNERITVKTQNLLWSNVTKTIETDTNKYAENTVKMVKLIPRHPQILTGDIDFSIIKWGGGDTTTYNIWDSETYIKTFNKNLFWGKKLKRGV